MEGINQDMDGKVLLKLSELNFQLGNNSTAISNLEMLELKYPGMGSLQMARIHASMGEPDLACNYLKKHLTSGYRIPKDKLLLDESFLGIESSRAWRDLWKNDWYSGEELLLQEIRHMINSEDYLYALETIDSKGDQSNLTAEFLALRATVLFHMDQLQGALKTYQEAIEMEPSNPVFYSGRSEIYASQSRYREAAADLDKAYRLNQEDFELLYRLSRMEQKAGNINSATRNSELYLEYFPSDPEANLLSGSIQFDAGRYFSAIERFNKCLELDQTEARYFKERGRCYLKTSTYQYASNDLSMALDLDPDDAESWYLRGNARISLGERDKAISDWHRAADLGSRDAINKLEEYVPR